MSTVELSDRTIDLTSGVVRVHDGPSLRLTSRELELVDFLARQPGGEATRDQLLVQVWGHAPDSLSRAVDLTVRRLRKKLEPDPGAHPRHLVTVYGTGYRIVTVPPPDPRGLPLSRDEALQVLLDADPGERLAAAPGACARLLESADRMPHLLVALGQMAAWCPADRLVRDADRLLAASPVAAGATRSLDAVSPDATHLARMLACLAGPVPLEVVEVVAQRPCLQALGELRTAGLLVPFADGVRLRAPIRQVLSQEADPAFHAALVPRRVAAVGTLGATLAERIERYGRTPDWLGLEALAPELRACLAAADVPNPSLWLALGRLPVHHPAVLGLLDHPAPPDPRVSIVRARWARLRRPLTEVHAQLDAACAALPEGHAYRRVGRLILARVCMDERDWKGALACLDPLVSAEPPDAIAGEACLLRCRVLLRLCDGPGARQALLEGMDILEGVGAQRLLATGWGIRADLLEAQVRRTEARSSMETALALHRASGNARGEAVMLTNLVNVLADLGDYEAVWTTAVQARAAHRRQGARRSEGILLANLAGIAATAQATDRAEAWGAQAVRICRALGLSGFEAQAWLNLATVSLGVGALDAAEDRVSQARQCAEVLGSAQLNAIVAALGAVVAACSDALDQARQRLRTVDSKPTATAAPALAASLDLMAGFVDLCEARHAADTPTAQHWIRLAAARIDALYVDGALRPAVDGTEVRGTLRLLRHDLHRTRSVCGSPA